MHTSGIRSQSTPCPTEQSQPSTPSENNVSEMPGHQTGPMAPRAQEQLPPFQLDNVVRSLLRKALDSNGSLGIGLSLAGEVGLDQCKKIPLPRDLWRFDGSRASHLASLAYQSAEKYERLNQTCTIGMTWMKESVKLAILTGCVGVGKMSHSALPKDFEGLCLLDWDSEVQIVDEDFQIPDDVVSDEQLRAWLPSSSQDMSSVAALVVAAKITWWTTGHHLGVRATPGLRHRRKRRSFYGFTEKVALSLGNGDFDMRDRSSQSRVHNMTHHWSTRAVWSALWAGKATTTRPLPIRPVPVSHKRSYRCAFTHMEFGEDVLLRLTTFGAGWAPLGDIRAALSCMSTSPVYIHAPGVSQVKEICELHNQVSSDPLRYGLAAQYLTQTATSSKFDKAKFEEIINSITAYLRAFLPKSQIASATPFVSDSRSDGISILPWYAFCVQAASVHAKKEPLTSRKLKGFLEITGYTANTSVPAGLVDAMRTVGIYVDESRLQKYIDILSTSPTAQRVSKPKPMHHPLQSPVEAPLTPAAKQKSRGDAGTRLTRATSNGADTRRSSGIHEPIETRSYHASGRGNYVLHQGAIASGSHTPLADHRSIDDGRAGAGTEASLTTLSSDYERQLEKSSCEKSTTTN